MISLSNKINFFLNLCLNKKADLPDNFPKWLKEHTDIKKAPKQLNKFFPIADFKIKINIENINNFLDKRISISIYNLFYEIKACFLYFLNNVSLNDKDKKIIKNFNELLNNYDSAEKINNCIISGYIDFANQKIKIFKFIKLLLDKLFELSDAFHTYDLIRGIPSDIKFIEGFGSYSNKHKFKNLYLVLSTKPEDILRMSSSSDWTSCQNMECGSQNEKIVSTALYNYIAILYVTNNDSTEYGEKMLYRTILRTITNFKTGEDAILMSSLYPDNNLEIKNILKKELENKRVQVFYKTPSEDWVMKYDIKDVEDYDYNSYEEPTIPKDDSFYERSGNISLENIKKVLNSSKPEKYYFFEKLEKILKDHFDNDFSLFKNKFNNYFDNNETKYLDMLYKQYKDWKREYEYDSLI